MMTEEMIIDGVDVSECGFFHPKYKDTDCHIALAFSEEYEGCMKCENNPNCYFKQRKRAEQKLKRIESVATDLLSLTNEYGDCYYKDECNKCDRVCQYRLVDKILQIIEGEEK